MDGSVKIIAIVPPIQAMFKALDGGGARISLDLAPECAAAYFQFCQKANRENRLVVGELRLTDAG